jgi:SOS-response transcriptional repressor LexA
MNNRGRPAFRSKQVLSYTRETLRKDGVAPSYGMICERLGIRTRQEVSRIVARLEREGELSRVGKGNVRRIRVHELC